MWYLAALAIAIAGALAWFDRRDRVTAALVGLLLSIVAFRMGGVGFHGLTSLAGAIAVIPLLVSGYRNARRAWRRAIRRMVVALAIASAVGALVALVAVAVHSGDLDSAVSDASDGLTAVEGGKSDAAAEALADASLKFESAAQTFNGPLLILSRAVPVVSQHVAAVGDLSDAGASLADSALRSVGLVDYDSLTLPDGGVDLDTLVVYRDPIISSDRAVDDAIRAIAENRSPWLFPPLESRMASLEDRLLDVAPDTELARLALDSLPAMLGGDGTRRYLLLFGSPAEGRDLGGHIGHWGELEADGGQLDLTDSGPIIDLWLGGTPNRRFRDDAQYPASYIDYRPEEFPQNWSASPDMPTVAAAAAELYPQSGGQPVDGVAYIDPYAIAAMLSITGPVTDPVTGTVLSADDAVRYLVADQYDSSDEEERSDVLTRLLDEMFAALTTTALPGPQRLADTLGPIVRGGHLQFWSFGANEAALLDRIGISGRLPSLTAGQDSLTVLTSNANPNKIDTYLTRSITHEVEWNRDAEQLDATTTVQLTNDAAPDLGNEVVVGNEHGLPPGTNRMVLSILSPLTASEMRIDDEPVPFSLRREFDRWRYSVTVEIPPGETVAVQLIASGTGPVGDTYQLTIAPQPLVTPDAMKVTIDTDDPAGLSAGPGISVNGGTATYEGTPTEDTLISISTK